MGCAIAGCDKKVLARGWCRSHYDRWRKHRDPEYVRERQTECSVEGCHGALKGHGLCNKHYQRLKAHGDPLGGGVERVKLTGRCDVKGCDRPDAARGYCRLHYDRLIAHGDPLYEPGPKYENEVCAVDGCGKRREAREWCKLHYWRWKRHGDPRVTRKTPSGAPKKFMAKAAVYRGQDCLIWPYLRLGRGYAAINQDGQPRYVHRLLCEQRNGPPPTPEHEVAHSCGRGHEGCVNPNHLRWATVKENSADRIGHGTMVRGEDHFRTRLTATDVLDIRRRAAAGEAHEAIALRFKMSKPGITKIVRRERWAHVK